jgi:uncharacterized protein involved in exopolysaccharide biosynthesis
MVQTTELASEARPIDFAKFLRPGYYTDLVRRRVLFFLVPFLVIAGLGLTVVRLLPAVYYSEAKILVESQQIPSELVRPTVNTLPAQRIQLIEQRLLTRDNLLALIEKFKLFPELRSTLSTTELVDRMREKTKVQTVNLGQYRGPADRATVVFTVGFEHENPVIATRVANELVTLIMDQDARSRTTQAVETTRFLAREVTRLQTELTSLDGQIAEAKRRRAEAMADSAANQAAVEETNKQIATLRAELLVKAAQFSQNHPDIKAIQRKLKALEDMAAKANQAIEIEGGLEILDRQRKAVQDNLEDISGKLSAARLGEALERGQQAEKLEVIEQPTQPQQPIKPKRLKLSALVLGLAFAAGAGLVVAFESLDTTIRQRSDLAGLFESYLIVSVPAVVTRQDHIRRRLKITAWVTLLLLVVLAGLAAAYIYSAELTLMWEKVMINLPRYLNR